jgi:acetamidase/formamidase
MNMKFLSIRWLGMLFIFTHCVAAQELGTEANPHLLKPTPDTVVWGHYWSETPPVLSIKSGDVVKLHTLVTSNPSELERIGIPPNEIEKELKDVQVVSNRGPGPHVLTGPISVEGAEPGDVLEVRILSVELATSYGYNRIGDSGFLSDEIFVRNVRAIRLDKGNMIAKFSPGIEIPLRPFFGSMGVAPPKEAGKISSVPPWIHAGNLDNKELVAGTTLFIPVHVSGANFLVGDGHAAQGNGEVDLTAIETSLTGKLQFIVRKDMKLTWPRAETPTHVITMGTDRNLTVATKIALREMLHYLKAEKGLPVIDAYPLMSIAVDLSITQLVDGRKGVHAMLPKAIFTSQPQMEIADSDKLTTKNWL